MNGIHDMGGMHGFGPIAYEENEPVFHQPWEGRLYGMRLAMGREQIFAPLGMRSAIENLDPALYLASPYYERWLLVTEQALVAKGFLTQEELEARVEELRDRPETVVPRREDPEKIERVRKAIYTHQSPHQEVGVVPRFKAGDAVRVRNISPTAHTRLPRYVRGKQGVIERYHGVHRFEDTVAGNSEPRPQAVYNVRFEARELWGDGAEVNQSLYIDMWESYIDPQ